jgi:hypothetical protein
MLACQGWFYALPPVLASVLAPRCDPSIVGSSGRSRVVCTVIQRRKLPSYSPIGENASTNFWQVRAFEASGPRAFARRKPASWTSITFRHRKPKKRKHRGACMGCGRWLQCGLAIGIKPQPTEDHPKDRPAICVEDFLS